MPQQGRRRTDSAPTTDALTRTREILTEAEALLADYEKLTEQLRAIAEKASRNGRERSE